MKPTEEQEDILWEFGSGAGLVIEAGAGAGKTSTLRMIAEEHPNKRGLYVAYNKAIQVDAAASFPSNVECRTAHSLAYAGIAPKYRRAGRAINGRRVPAAEAAQILGIREPIRYADDRAPLAPQQIARIVVNGIDAFCKSADDEPTVAHLRAHGLVDALGPALLPFLHKAWADLCAPAGQLRLTLNAALKMYQLARPRLRFDFVTVDEAQDLNPCVAAIMANQTDAQVVYVGDRCQPAGTMVTVIRGAHRRRWPTPQCTPTEQIPIEDLAVGDTVVSYDIPRAFLRRTGSPVSGVTARPFRGTLITVETETGQSSRYTPDHHCLVQIAPAIRDKYVLYIMRRGDNYRMGIAAGLATTQGNRAGFMIRASQEDADAVWVLDVFDTRQEASIAEQIASWTYGIPQLTFRSTNKNTLGQEHLDAIWSKVGGNRDRAHRAMTAYGRALAWPLWLRGDDMLMVRRATVVRAVNLLDGMAVLTENGAMQANGKRAHRNLWTPVTVRKEAYDGLVYSMTVERDHTYVGDGIVTHNCQAINGWNGAVDAMSDAPGVRLQLTQSFRFGPAIADVANEWLDLLGATMQLRGTDRIASTVGPIVSPTAILCRTNAGTMGKVMALAGAGRRVALVGSVADDLRRLAEAAMDLQAARGTDHPDLLAFRTWREVQVHADEDQSAGDLRTLVKLVDTHTPRGILSTLDGLCSEDDADIAVSTAHRSKGREWSRVQVADDFFEPPPGEPLELEYGMLAYVTVTRAREALDPGQLGLSARPSDPYTVPEWALREVRLGLDGAATLLTGVPDEQADWDADGYDPPVDLDDDPRLWTGEPMAAPIESKPATVPPPTDTAADAGPYAVGDEVHHRDHGATVWTVLRCGGPAEHITPGWMYRIASPSGVQMWAHTRVLTPVTMEQPEPVLEYAGYVVGDPDRDLAGRLLSPDCYVCGLPYLDCTCIIADRRPVEEAATC